MKNDGYMKFVRYGVAEDSGLLQCYAVLLVKYFLIFQMHYKPTNQCLSVKTNLNPTSVFSLQFDGDN